MQADDLETGSSGEYLGPRGMRMGSGEDFIVCSVHVYSQGDEIGNIKMSSACSLYRRMQECFHNRQHTLREAQVWMGREYYICS